MSPLNPIEALAYSEAWNEGVLAFQKKHYRKAIGFFEKMMGLMGKYGQEIPPAAMEYSAKCYEELGKTDKAEECYSEAIAEAENFADKKGKVSKKKNKKTFANVLKESHKGLKHL